MNPQPVNTHEEVRNIIEDVTQSSSMRLDTVSMGKLWDLITMVFKWQLSVTDDVIGKEVDSFIINIYRSLLCNFSRTNFETSL